MYLSMCREWNHTVAYPEYEKPSMNTEDHKLPPKPELNSRKTRQAIQEIRILRDGGMARGHATASGGII